MSPAARAADPDVNGARLVPIPGINDAARQVRFSGAEGSARPNRRRRLAAVRFSRHQSLRDARPRHQRDGDAALLCTLAARGQAGRDCASHRARVIRRISGRSAAVRGVARAARKAARPGGWQTVAMEVSPADAVPYLDRVPHGVIQLIESFGARVVSSGVLITRFAARWSATELAGHRRAAEAIAEIAKDTLRWAGAELARGAEVRETGRAS